MFGKIRGMVIHRTARYVFVQAPGDALAYEIRIDPTDVARVGDEVDLWVLQGRGVKDSIALYGTRSREERMLAFALLHVGGIGIAKAFDAARSAPMRQIVDAIERKDAKWMQMNVRHMGEERAKECVAVLWRRIHEMISPIETLHAVEEDR